MVASTSSATGLAVSKNWFLWVVEPVVAEPIETSKRPQEKANEDSGFDRLNHQESCE